MATSLSNVAAKLNLQEPNCQYSRAVPSVSTSVSRYAQQCPCRKEILGTSLLPQNAPLYDPPFRKRQQHQKLRRLTVEAAKRVDNMRSFLLNSTLKAQDSEIDKVSKLCDDIRTWAREKQKDASAGCKHFECYVDLYEKNVFHFMEEYNSVLHMNDFRACPEHTKFFEEVRPFLLEPIGLAVYELRDGKVSCMLNPIGPKGEGGLDDATGQSGRSGEKYMQPKAKKKRGIEFEEKLRAANAQTPADEVEAEQEAGKKVEENEWSFEKIVARVLRMKSKSEGGSDPAKDEQWSLKSLFGRKK